MEKQTIDNEINLKELITPYLKKWYWFIISGFIALVLGFLYLKKQQSVYSIQTTVLIKDSKSNSLGGDLSMLGDLSAFGSMGSDAVENEIEVLKSKKLMEQVVKNLNLQADVFVEGTFRNKELYAEKSPIIVKVVDFKKMDDDVNTKIPPFFKLIISGQNLTVVLENKEIKSKFNKLISLPYANIMILKNEQFKSNKKEKELLINISSVDARVNHYQELLSVNLVERKSTVLGLSMNHSVVHKGKDILNELISIYNQDALEDKNFANKKSAEFIDERIMQIGKDLGKVESEKQEYKQNNNITDILTEAQLNLKTNAEVRKKEIELESQLDLTGTLLNYAKRQSFNETLPANIGLDNPGAIQSINTYNQLVLQRNQLLENGTKEHPSVISVTEQMRELRPSILQNLKKHKKGLELAISNYRKQINKTEGRIAKMPAQERKFRSLERQQQIKENLYLILLQKREEAKIAMAMTGEKAKVLDKAYKGKKVAPRKMIVLLVSLILGCLIPIGVVFLQELLDNKIKSKHDLDKLLNGKTILGEIPSVQKGQSETVGYNDLSPMAEAFRIVLTNVNFMLPQKSGKKIFVTSTVKGEGKTFIAANLALTLANPSKKVIIIGADIRNPQLQRFNNEGKGLIGLTEYLHEGDISVEDIIHTSTLNKYLDVVYSGAIPPNPTHLLSSANFKTLLEDLEKQYDYIVVDTAPLMLVTDTYLIANHADATVYVTRSEYTERQLIEYANNQVEAERVKNVGFVINDVKKDYFGYGNKYGYGYGADNRTFIQKLKDRFRG
ncbi:MAG: capsular biosynthesis protein [Flavobacteriales bacterium]|nr:MAG: capsular biosynthesis protein [Flavobacteriales bacterium]